MKKGWEVKKLGEVCDIIGGGTPSKSNRSFYQGEIPWATVRDMKSDFLEETEFKINDLAVKNSSTNLIPKDNVVIATRVGLGKICILQNDTAINQDLKGIIPKKQDQLFKRFLFHWFKYVSNEIIENGTGATVQGVKVSFVENLKIPIPPLSEQKRIVAILDEAFAAIGRAKTNVENNLRNARELFESYLQEVFEEPGEDWEEKRLGELVVEMMTGPFGSMLHKSDYVEMGIPVVNPQNIVNGVIVPLQKTMISESTFTRLEKYALKEGDIIMARRGEMGRCAIVKKENAGWLCGTGSLIIRANKNKVDVPFLNLCLSSSTVKNHLEKESIGATMNNLNQNILSEIKITLPPINLQKEVMGKFDSLFNQTQALETHYRQKLSALEELKKSILQKAFAGELT